MPRWEVRTFINSLLRGRLTTIIATGIELSKNVFAVRGENLGGAVLLRQPKVGRAKLGRSVAQRAMQEATDAAAVCEAMQRLNVRLVPVKTTGPPARWMVHRARQGYVTERAACVNCIRVLLTRALCCVAGNGTPYKTPVFVMSSPSTQGASGTDSVGSPQRKPRWRVALTPAEMRDGSQAARVNMDQRGHCGKPVGAQRYAAPAAPGDGRPAAG